MTLGHLNKIFERAIAENHGYVAIAVKNGVQHDPEIIVNLTTNFRSKLDYYNKAYKYNPNENTVELVHNSNIQITGVESGNNLTVLFKKLGAM